jgi:hypothetical protein
MGKSITATTTFKKATARRAANMSVIQETEAGDEIIVIQEFNASPEGKGFSWDTSRRFRVGDRVRLVRFFQDSRTKDIPGLGWTVTIETSDGERFAATQTHFVTEECWQKMKAKRRASSEENSGASPNP